uniref:Tail protein n=1 Tax=viral metagenome TaxID=1070528 RepID=A0A6H2A489_9ZZZZ
MLSATNAGFYAKLKLWPETTARNTAYTVGDVIKPTTYASHAYKCTTAGTSHASTEPTWGITNGGTTVDGTATFTCYDTKTYQIKAKQADTVPYVTFGPETDVPIGTFASVTQMESLTYWVNCFSSKSAADVAEIADEVMTAVDDCTLTVTGYTPMKCVREFIGSTIWDSETDIYQIPLRYRIWLSR